MAQDLSSQDDEPYYKLSLEAYEKALALQPKNAGLKAAVDFAREQKACAAQWDQARRDAASSYIEVRKSELAASGFYPTVQTHSPPTPPTPPAAVAASYSAPASQPAVTYQYPVYQPYYYTVPVYVPLSNAYATVPLGPRTGGRISGYPRAERRPACQVRKCLGSQFYWPNARSRTTPASDLLLRRTNIPRDAFSESLEVRTAAAMTSQEWAPTVAVRFG